MLRLLGEDGGAKNQLKRLYEYCNKSEANLLRAGVALSYVLGIEAIERDQTYDQHGVAYVGTLEWLKSIGYQPTELETAFAERVTKDRIEDEDLNEAELSECRICGCTDEQSCEGGCVWVEDPIPDQDAELCSRCLAQAVLEARGDDEGPLAGDITDDEAAEYLGLTLENARAVLSAPVTKAVEVYKELLKEQEEDAGQDVVTDGHSTPIEEDVDPVEDTAAAIEALIVDVDGAIDALTQGITLEDLGEVPVGHPVDQRTCRECGCHEDCKEGCVWVELVDAGPLCSNCDSKKAVVAAVPEKAGPVDQRARRQ